MKSFKHYISEANKKMVDGHMRNLEKTYGDGIVKKNKKEITKKVTAVVKNFPPGITNQGKDSKRIQWEHINDWIKKNIKK